MPSPWKISLRYVNNILRKKKKKRHKTESGGWQTVGDSHLDGKTRSPLADGLCFMKDGGGMNSPGQDYRRDRRRAWSPESNVHFQHKNLQRKKFVDGGREGGFVTYDAKETKKSNTERWTNAEPGRLLLPVHKRKETICCCEHSESIAKTPCSGDEKHRLYHTPGSSLVLQ